MGDPYSDYLAGRGPRPQLTLDGDPTPAAPPPGAEAAAVRAVAQPAVGAAEPAPYPGMSRTVDAISRTANAVAGEMPRGIESSPNEPPMSLNQEHAQMARHPSQRADIRHSLRAEFVMPDAEARAIFVRQGLIKPEDIDNEAAFRESWERTYVQNVAAPVRHRLADQGAAKRGAWYAATVDPVIKRAEVAMPLVALAGGGQAIDYKGYRERLFLESKRRIEVLTGVRYHEATPEQRELMNKRAESIANSAFDRAVNRYKGVPWADPFSEDITDWVMQLPAPVRPFAAVMRPMSTTTDVMTPSSLKSERSLSQFGRLAPTTALTAMMKTGESWGSRESIEEIRRGVDPFGELHMWGDFVLQNFYDDPRSAAPNLRRNVGIGIVLPMILMEPDPLSLSLGLAAPLAKVASVTSIQRRIGSKAEIGQKALDDMRAGGKGVENDAHYKLRREAPATRLAMEIAGATALAKPVDEVFGHLQALRKELTDLGAEAAAAEAKALKAHGPVNKGGKPKGTDESTLALFRAENAREQARVQYAIAMTEAEYQRVITRVAMDELFPEMGEIGASYKKGQQQANAQLKEVQAELTALQKDPARAAAWAAVKKNAQIPLDAVRALPEVAAWLKDYGIRVTGARKAGGPPVVVAARVEGEDLFIAFAIPGTRGRSWHKIAKADLTPPAKRMLRAYSVGEELALKEFNLAWGSKIDTLTKQKNYLLRMKAEFKAGGPLRALLEKQGTLTAAAKVAERAYAKAFKQWEAAEMALKGGLKETRKGQKAVKGATTYLRESIEDVARTRARAVDAEVLRNNALDAMQGVVDSLRTHRRHIKESYGGLKGALAPWDEISKMSKIQERRAQTVAAKAIRAGFKYVDETTVAWDPVAAEAALKLHPGHGGIDYLDLPTVFRTPQNLSGGEIKIVQDEIDRAAMRIETEFATKSDRAWGAAIQSAWDDVEILAHGDLRQQMTSSLVRLSRRFDYIAKAIGTQGEQMSKGLRVAENTADLGFNEFKQFMRGRTGSPKEILKGIDEFMTGGLKTWKYKGSGSTYKAILRGENPWDVGRQAMVDATFRDPRKIKDLEIRHEAHKVEVQEEIDTYYRKLQDEAEELGQPAPDYDYFVLEQQRIRTEAEGLKHALQPETNFMVMTIARSRIPVGANVTDKALNELYASTAAAIANKNNSFQNVMDVVGAITWKYYKNMSSKQDAYTKSAAAVVVATGVSRLGAHAKQVAGGLLEMDDAIAFNRMISGETANLKVGDDVRGAQAAIRVGQPFTEAGFRVTADQNINTLSKELVEIGDMAIVPKAMVEHMKNRYGDYLKDLSPYFRKPIEAGATDRWTAEWAYNAWMQAWKTSVVTGVAIPNPRYWVNNVFGDFSQMWGEVGLLRSGALSFQNVLSNFGAGGRALQVGALQAAEGLDKAGRKMGLPSVMEVFMNPYLGRVFKGEKGFFRTKYGRTIQFDELRRMALDDGILETFVHEELLKQLGKKNLIGGRLGALGNRAKWWQDDLSEAAALTQQRQRMALYADLLQRGATRAEAKERTLSALYDWKHGIAQGEINWLTRTMPFYRFWRLAMKQVQSGILEPFTRPSGDYLARAMTGRTRLARARQQTAIVYGLPDMAFSENPDEAISQAEALNEFYKIKFPAWMDTKTVMGASAMSLAKRQWLLENHGRTATHTATTLPPFTMLDSYAMANSMLTVVSWAATKGKRMLPWGDTFDYSSQPAEMDATAFEPFMGMTFPGMEWLLRTAGDNAGLKLSYTNRSDYRNLSPAEEAVFRMTDLGEAFIIDDAETGRAKVPSWAHVFFRSIPGVGTQAPYWAAAKHTNPYWDPNALLPRDAEAYKYAFRQISKLGTEYHYDAPKAFEYEQKGIKERLAGSPWREGLKEAHPRRPKAERKPLPPDVK